MSDHNKVVVVPLHQSTMSSEVVWGGIITFSLQNGVKQGVLSPRLFNIYLDELLCRLKRSGMGRYYGNVYVGFLAYADDVVLLSPTLGSLKEMLNICEQYSSDFNILFNASKTKLMVFGRNVSKVDVVFQGGVASKVNNVITKLMLEILSVQTYTMMKCQ